MGRWNTGSRVDGAEKSKRKIRFAIGNRSYYSDLHDDCQE